MVAERPPKFILSQQQNQRHPDCTAMTMTPFLSIRPSVGTTS
jgi:hypothetical protein